MTMQDLGLLSLLVWLPILGGLVVLALGQSRVALGRWVALATSLEQLRAVCERASVRG